MADALPVLQTPAGLPELPVQEGNTNTTVKDLNSFKSLIFNLRLMNRNFKPALHLYLGICLEPFFIFTPQKNSHNCRKRLFCIDLISKISKKAKTDRQIALKNMTNKITVKLI